MSRNRSSPAAPSRIATAATALRSPASIAARRTSPPEARPPWRPRRSSRLRARPDAARRGTARRVVAARARSRARESSDSASRRAACEPLPEIPWSRVTAASTSRSSSVGCGRGARTLPQRRPADADRSLRQLAREIGDRDRNLLRARSGEELRDPLDLLQARGRPGDLQRRSRDLGQEQGFPFPLRAGRARSARHDRDATRPRPPRSRAPARASSPRR